MSESGSAVKCSLLIINPRDDFPSYFGGEVAHAWGARPAATIADLATTTLAALAPPEFEVAIIDENIETVDFELDVDYVALTGKVSQRNRMAAIAREFQRRERVVIIGGPYASLDPAAVREFCDVLVRGEVEEIAERFFADLHAGDYCDEYVGTRPSLAESPVPRWDLYTTERALVGSVQTSRGCPFECDFCDVIQYLGRHQRHKPISAVLEELDELYRRGFRNVFLADDNLTVVRPRAKELLAALRDWNRARTAGKVLFCSQVSIDASKDPELLDLCATAGLVSVFIGIETPNFDSLQQSKKRQNIGGDLVERIGRFYDHGIVVVGGMIVGFDSDGPDIFERQLAFATDALLPVVTAGALVAPAATPLRARLEAEGRLVEDGEEIAAAPWSTNFRPRQMSRQELFAGMKWLVNALYSPAAFGDRMVGLCRRLGKRRDPKYRAGELIPWRVERSVDRDARRIAAKVALLGGREAVMVARIMRAAVANPGAIDLIGPMLLHYGQLRLMYERGGIWDQSFAQQPSQLQLSTEPA